MKTHTSQTTATHVEPFTSLAEKTSRATRKAALLLLSVAALLTSGAAAVRGQSALDGFDPNANGAIRVAVVQADGKILLGGDFTTLSPNGGAPVTRNHIARLNADGTLDTAFDPNANDLVLSLTVQPDGRILAGGFFTSIGGQTRNRIARLNAATGLADSWDPNANFNVLSIAVQVDGKILVGGTFGTIGGQTRNYIARLDAATGLADTWNPLANGPVFALAVQSDGKILVGGEFTNIGGQNRNRIARLDATSGLADPWNANSTSSGQVLAIAVQSDGKILAGGSFTNMGGQNRNAIARLDATSGLADPWNPNPDAFFGHVLTIAVQSDGKVLVGGSFSTIGGQNRNRIARLDAVTGLADSLDPSANGGNVYTVAVQQDGKILAGGDFSTLTPNGGAAVTRNFIARLETNGGIDKTLDLGLNGTIVLATAIQSDGKILIGGDFTSVLGVTRNKIARLNADGTLDMSFNPNANATVFGIAVQPDGKIIVAGQFAVIGGQTRNGIARVDPVTGAADAWNPFVNGFAYEIALQTDGKIVVGGNFTAIGGQQRSSIGRLDPVTGLADSFNPGVGGEVKAIAIQADGKILVGGPFSMMGGQARSGIARLDPATGLADSWDPSANGGHVFTIAVQPDGKVLVGGNFGGSIGIGGQPRNYIARLDAVTGLPDSWNPNADNEVNSISVQADGRVLASGNFTTIGGQTRNRIARLDGVTGLADSFDPDANARVETVTVLPDGKIFAGGVFTTIGGQPRNTFARLSNDTAALQNLAVTTTTVTWTRGGSSSQFPRATFESSNDNVTYTPLGNGTASGSNWTLLGLNLPTGQNFYIRARGYYRSGYQNGSESTAETVRNIFIPLLQLTTAASRKTHGGVGDFDIDLPLSGEPGVECRSSGGNHTVVFTFNNKMISGDATLSTQTGGTISGSPTVSDNTITVNLSGVTDVQQITVTLSNVTDTFAQVLPDTSVSMNMLIGDTTANKVVNASDVSQTKAQSGSPVTLANFREDVMVSGDINGSDISLVKSQTGIGLPLPTPPLQLSRATR